MKTTTRKFKLNGDTIFLALALKRLASRARVTRQGEWLCEEIERELVARAQSAMQEAA